MKTNQQKNQKNPLKSQEKIKIKKISYAFFHVLYPSPKFIRFMEVSNYRESTVYDLMLSNNEYKP